MPPLETKRFLLGGNAPIHMGHHNYLYAGSATRKKIVSIHIRAPSAESGPPPGTVLSNSGLNSINLVPISMNSQGITCIFCLKGTNNRGS
jgi:hypothetical protein